MDEKLNMSLDEIITTKKMTPSPKAKLQKKKLKAEKHAALEAENAQRRLEKKRLKDEAHAKHLVSQEKIIVDSIEKLEREVSLQFDTTTALAGLENAMAKHGKMKFFKKCGGGLISVRYEKKYSVTKALKAKKMFVKIPVLCRPAEIKHHAVFFNAPEEMGDIDDEILKQIEVAMGAHGKVVMCRKKGRAIVIFFSSRDTRDGLVSPSNANEVTIEIGDHSVKLHPGLPPNIRKRRNMAKAAKKAAREEAAKAAKKAAKEEAMAAATGQPYKRIKSE
jgi:hypothetical protein